MRKAALCVMALCLVCVLASPASAREFIAIGTGGTGGTYYPYGGAMASIYNKNIDGIQASAEVTGASVENTRLLARGELNLAMAMNDVVYQAVHGEGDFKSPVAVRTLFEMYPNVFHAVTLQKHKDINNMLDLKGKEVSVGSPGSGTETMAKLILSSLGVEYDDFDVHRLSFAENTQALKDNVIDAGIWSVGPPTSSIMDLATTHDIKIMSFTEDQMNKVVSAHPYYSDWKIKAGTYDGQEKTARTPSVWNTVLVHKDMSVDMAYNLAKVTFEHRQDLQDVYIGAKATTPENTIANAVAPLHPGVIKYFEELGLDVPEDLVPSEMK
ncbi:MAG: TAXI family TRAP transporter solute-binding subunit [Desulfovermiculus sp.]|nr:TAXI family TRAP transporter solute-binding subunit [Desulfovermiculus sp.]